MVHPIKSANPSRSGRVLVPALLWVAGVPLSFVFILWLLFFRG